MGLAHMVALDEAALTCDLAESYHVLNWRTLPARLVAVLALGLRPGSRIMLRISGAKLSIDTQLLAIIADAVRVLAWQNTRDGLSGRNAPESVFAALTGAGSDSATDAAGFDSPEAFDAWRKRMIGGE